MTRLLIHSDASATNDSRIYRYIYEQQSISRTAVAHHLRLSLPTVKQHFQTLLDDGIITVGEMCDSTGGRKAQAFNFNAAYRYAVGVDIWQESYEIVIVDLYGGIVAEETIPFHFENTLHFYETFSASVHAFIEKSAVDQSRILGIGISLQGIVSADGEKVIYGDAMNTIGLERAHFAAQFPWPCLLIHNVDAAAYAESWYHEDLGNAFYLFLCEYFGASLIIDGHPYKGDNATGSTIEHMCLIPDGQACYCGKRGCVEAYCSEKALFTQVQESKEEFFQNLRAGYQKEDAAWTRYLRKLALVIDNIRMVIHSQVIIGGTLARHFEESDLHRLEKYVQEISAFKVPGHFISIGICGRNSCAKGAALQFVIEYLNRM